MLQAIPHKDTLEWTVLPIDAWRSWLGEKEAHNTTIAKSILEYFKF